VEFPGALELVEILCREVGPILLQPAPQPEPPGAQPLVQGWTRELPSTGGAPASSVTKLVSLEARPSEGLRNVTWHFDVQPQGGALERVTVRFSLRMITAGELELTPLLLRAGDVLISDARTLHRGTANRTDEPRPFAVIVYNRDWYHLEGELRLEANEETPMLLESFYRTLPPAEQNLLRRVPRTDD